MAQGPQKQKKHFTE